MGHGDPVRVVGHPAVAQQRDLLPLAVLAQRLNVAPAIQIGIKNGLAVIAPPLRNVVRHAHRHHASESSHGQSIL
jgi:hypothetical protein